MSRSSPCQTRYPYTEPVVVAVSAWLAMALLIAVGSSGWEGPEDGCLVAATFVASFVVWLGSQNDGRLCVPDSWLQGHALWHLGCAGSTVLLYLYMRSQRDASGEPA